MLETKELGFEIICDIYPLLEPEPYESNVLKHADHDQSDHGNREGNGGTSSPEGGSAEQRAMYAAAYSKSGFEPLENVPRRKDGTEPELTQIKRGISVPVPYGLPENSEAESGLTVDEFRALESYQMKGYSEINDSLRSKSEEEALKFDLGRKISVLDSLIARVPEVKSETPLYRVFAKKIVGDLEPGQILRDKGFLSTTHLDLTDSSHAKALADFKQTLSFGQEMVVGRIVPNGNYSGINVNSVVSNMFYKEEEEFILPRGSELRYLGSSKTPLGDTFINFERISK